MKKKEMNRLLGAEEGHRLESMVLVQKNKAGVSQLIFYNKWQHAKYLGIRRVTDRRIWCLDRKVLVNKHVIYFKVEAR